MYSKRIIAHQLWSSLILILLSPCQNWLLLLFHFSDLPVRFVAVPLLAKFLAKLQTRFWAKFSGKFQVNYNLRNVRAITIPKCTLVTLNYHRILTDWVCSAYSHVDIFSELWKIEQYIFLSSEVDEFITCAAKFFIYFAQMNLFRQGLSEHIKALLGFYRYLYELGNDPFILKNTDYRSSHLKG